MARVEENTGLLGASARRYPILLQTIWNLRRPRRPTLRCNYSRTTATARDFLQRKTFGPRTRAEIFGNLKHLLRQSKIELLDNREFLEQLLNLEELTKDAGRIDIQPAGTMRDDLAVVVALCCDEVCKQEGALPEPRLGIVDRSLRFLNYIPSDCPVAAV